MHTYIRCNGWKVHVDLRERRVLGDWGGEQCEGCGLDIAGTGQLRRLDIIRPARWVVRCDDCGTQYDVLQTDAQG